MASTQPLAKKLLIKPGDRLAPLNAPKNYKSLLGALPEGAEIVARAPRGAPAWCACLSAPWPNWKPRSPRAQQAMAKGGGIWVSWQKKSAGKKSDVTRDTIMAFAPSLGLDSVRPVAIDDEWSALKLVSR